jgi:hypothetical protein
MIRYYDYDHDITVKFIEFDDFRHFCQWIKTMTNTSKTVDELEKDGTAKRAWEIIESRGEFEINPTLWYEN